MCLAPALKSFTRAVNLLLASLGSSEAIASSSRSASASFCSPCCARSRARYSLRSALLFSSLS
jgi:hypothetical protein